MRVGRACGSGAFGASLCEGVSDLITFHTSVTRHPQDDNGGESTEGKEGRTGKVDQTPVCTGPAGGLRRVDRVLVVDEDVDGREVRASETRGQERTGGLKGNEFRDVVGGMSKANGGEVLGQGGRREDGEARAGGARVPEGRAVGVDGDAVSGECGQGTFKGELLCAAVALGLCSFLPQRGKKRLHGRDDPGHRCVYRGGGGRRPVTAYSR